MTILSAELAKRYAEVTVSGKRPKDTGANVFGTVTEYNGSKYVKLDGSDQLTPVTRTADVKTGDRVTVHIENHTATVTGNVSSPSARTDDVRELGDKITEVDTLVADKVSTWQLEAEVARIDDLESENISVKGRLDATEAKVGSLEAEDAKITGTLTANQAAIDALEANKLDAAVADVTYATIDSLEASDAYVRNLEADYADFKSATADDFQADRAAIDDLKAGKLDADTADIRYANIDFANIGEAALRKIFADSGIIKDIVVSGGTVTGELVGVTIKGDLIEGNTIVADKLVVKGTDGLYYKLNTDGMGVEAQQTDYNSLNGSVIRAKSITATKISVDDLVAFGATIGGFKIDSHSIYSGVKNSSSNTTRGVFLGDDGQLAVGDASNFVKYYRDTDGSYKLAIQADSIEFKSSNLKVGGRNLLASSLCAMSKDDWSAWFTPSAGIANSCGLAGSGVTFPEGTKVGDVFTLSLDLEWTKFAQSGGVLGMCFFQFYANGSWSSGIVTPISIPGPGTSAMLSAPGHARLSKTFEITAENQVTANFHFNFRVDYSDGTGKVRTRRWKLERGNHSTDWTPAPEDVDDSIAAKSSIRQVERNRSDTMAQLRNYASEGHRDTWTTWKSYSGISPGDTVQLKCDCSDTGKPVYILMTVESVTPTSATCVSHGMVDPNAELAARAYTDAKVKVESDRITAEVTERGKLGTKVATLEQTASGLQSQVTSVKGTADAAKAYADNKGMFKETVDLSAASWDAGTYYPVVGTRIPSSGYHDFQVNVQLNSGTKPPWSTHAQGFTCNLSARMKAGGWGTVNYGTLGWIDDSSFNYCDGMPAYIAQNTNSSKPVLYLRGGGRYFVYCSYGCAWEPKPSSWTENEQTYAPTATPSNSSALVSSWAQRDAVVQHASKITQLESSISAEVSARTALGTRVSTLEQTADGLSSQVSSVRSFRSFTTNYSYGQAQVNQYGTPGYQGTWAVNESTAGLKAGDTVQLRVTNASKSGHAFIVGTVVSAPSDRSVVARTTGLVDTGDRGATGASGTDLSQGRAMYADPFFSSGTNGCSAYNNAGGGTVAVARQARSSDNPCSQSGHELKVTTSGAASPGHGGVYQTIQSRANAVFVRRVIAKIPAGYSLMNAENSMGSGYSCEWLTDRAGTGAFREYLYRYRCGSSGTFSSGGHMYLTGGAAATASAPVVWHLACCQTYDMTGAPDSSEALAAASSLAQTVTELSTRVDQTNSSITDSIARKTTEISALQGALSGLSGDLGSVSGRVSEVEASFRRTMDAGGNPQLDLMTTANGFGTRITNTEMAFMDSGQKVAYVSNKRLYIEQAEVVGQMQVGDYAFVQRPGHLSLKYVGA